MQKAFSSLISQHGDLLFSFVFHNFAGPNFDEIMKRIALILCMVLTMSAHARAFQTEEDPPEKIELKGTNSTSDHRGPHRSPAASIYVYQQQNTLVFSTAFAGCEILLSDSDGLQIYSDYVPADGKVMVPNDIVGEYELLLIVGEITYTAIIDF